MLVCNLTAWIWALEHTLLTTETHAHARLPLASLQLEARLWTTALGESSVGLPWASHRPEPQHSSPLIWSLSALQCGNMAREGLRVLVVAKKSLTEEQYQDFEVSGS